MLSNPINGVVVKKELEQVVQDVVQACERVGRVSIERYNYSELAHVHPALTDKLVDRLSWWVGTLSDTQTSQAVEAAKAHPKYHGWLHPVLSHLASKGAPPRRARLPKLSSEQLSSEYRALFPFLMDSLGGERTQLVGYSNGEGNIWFSAVVDKAKTARLRCVGYQGDVRFLHEDKLNQVGYKRIDAEQPVLKKMCRADVGEGVPVDDIKKVGFHIGRKVFAGVRREESLRKLDAVLNGIPLPVPRPDHEGAKAPKV
jgi:hypothetical protein